MYSNSNGTFDDEYIRYVLDAYSVTIIRLCRSYVKNIHDAEDMAQDVFCELIRRRKVFDSEEHEKAWLIRTAINKCKNHLKSGWVKKTVAIEESDACSVPDSGGNPEELTDTTVLDAVLALPEKYRTVIHLYYYGEMSIAEIAQTYRISPATVGTRLSRGRELLRQRLGEDF